MKKTKLQKGITLIALIITIVVLLIIAVVTIGVVQESGIIGRAQKAGSDYQTKADEENTILDGYLATIEENLPGAGNGGDDPNIKGINDTNISEILTKWLEEERENDEVLSQLKVEIPTIQEDNIYDMLIIMESDTYYVYIYEIERLYRFDMDTNTFEYAEKEQYAEQYDFGENVKKVEIELERIFVGKTVSEIQEKYNAGTLDEYVIENSDSITDIVFLDTSDEYIRLSSVTITKEDNEKTISRDDDNYSMYIYSNEEIYYKVEISLGT